MHINHIATKARKLVGMLYRKYYSWTDTSVLRCIYLTCIRPHLEYACQLWDPHTQNGVNILESVQKFACKVCLKQWDLDYDLMLAQLNIPKLVMRRKYLKLTTMYNIVKGNCYFPSDIFLQDFNNTHLRNQVTRYIRPYSHTNYMFSSFVPSVIALWNNLPANISTSSISSFKRSLLYHFEAHAQD